MKPVLIWAAVFALFGVAVVAPAWMHYLGLFEQFPAHIQFLANLALPLLVALIGASWLQPGGS